jgi:hypothetical protein
MKFASRCARFRNCAFVMTTRRAQRDVLCDMRSLRLCETQLLPRVSYRRDNCKEIFCRVYSHQLHKGKPVERRGRKASGPSCSHKQRCVGRRIAGLPARTSVSKFVSSFLVRFSSRRRYFSFALAEGATDGAAQRSSSVARAYKTKNWEQRKLTRANPSKGGDAEPPVYRTPVLRQRGYPSHRIDDGKQLPCARGSDSFLSAEFLARGRKRHVPTTFSRCEQ